MRKKVLLPIVLLIFVGLVAAVPYIDGCLFKSNYMDMIAVVNLNAENNNNPIKLEVTEYHVGWLHSHAKIRVVPSNKEAVNYFPQGITTEDEISHGPIVYDRDQNKYTLAFALVTSGIYLPQELSQMIFDKAQNQAIVTTQTLVTFNNEWQHRTKIPPLTLKGIGRLQIQDSNSISRFKIENNSIKELDLKGVLGAISFQGETSNPIIPTIAIQPISAMQNSILQPIGLWNSRVKISMPGISVKWSNGTTFIINNLEFDSERGIGSNNLYNVNAKLFIKEIQFPSDLISSVSSLNINLLVNNLNPNGLNEYRNFIKSHPASAYNNNDSKILLNIYPKIITATTTFNMDIAFNSSLGAFSLKSKAINQPNVSAPTTVSDLLDNIGWEANLRIAAPMLNKLIEISVMKMQATVNQARISGSMVENQNAPTANVLQQQVAVLLKQGKISLPDSIQVLDLATQKLSVDSFSAKLSPALPPDVSAVIIQAYKTVLATSTQTSTQVAKPSPQPQQNPAEKAQQMIDSWVQQGYFTREGNDYLTTITTGGGVFKMNGKVLDQATSSFLGVPSTTAPTTNSLKQSP